ncbi:hypothetical protein V7S43_014573 [Phytophthora oleae]|uniref:Uncharacterized protein n=1 Tax=Phytophthora oleae TaxID=2107226 RepID=A0ABD3F0U1_9STRA
MVGPSRKVKRHNVTFWDFAGQDVYQVTHALFYSERTLYLICVDLSKYAEKLKEVDAYSRSEKRTNLQRFFEENVLRWVRLILFRQPSAQFKVIGTKEDLVSEDQLKDISRHMNACMKSFVDNFNMKRVTDDVKRALDANFKPNNLVTTSANQVDSIEKARESIKRAIIENSKELSFMMTVTYSKVLDWIFKTKQSCKGAASEDRVKQMIVPFDDLFIDLKVGLEDVNQCQEILRALHRLGDVLWYEDKDANPDDLVILDPKMMLELVREVVNHSYEGRTGESYDALRRDGTLHHSLLMTFSWWKALEAVDGRMVYLFKHLLKHFNLAYPASNVVELATVDMIVPAYWKTRAAAAQDLGKSLSKQQSALTRNDVAGEAIAKWHYRQDTVRKVGATHVECFVRGIFAVINFVAERKKLCDNVTIEVAAATKEIAWAEMRDFVMAMEVVLIDYKGLNTAKQNEFERFVIDSENNLKVVSGLMGDTREMDRLRSENPWLPPDFEWFIQRAWEYPGKLDELKAQKITLQLNHRLDVLKQLVASSGTRHFPALWTLLKEASVIKLRIHSDLTGECHHQPLNIKVSNDFLTRYANLFQVGISILPLASSLIPIEIAKTAVGMVLDACQTGLESVQTVGSILARAGLNPGEVKSSTELDMPVPSRISFLRELLMIHDEHFDDSKVSELSNLCCVADSEGRYVWVHKQELEGLQHGFTLCDPPKVLVTPQIKSISIQVTQLLWAGREASQKNIFCEWEDVGTSGQR